VLDRPGVNHPAGALTFRLLGPFEVLRDGDALELGGPQQRAVPAHLVLEAGRVVPVDRLISRVWGDEPPAAALGTLQSYISHLRRALEPGRPAGTPARVLASEAPGYLLRVERDTIDVFRFESLADDGRRAAETGDVATALARFDEALALWRGPALAGLAGEVSVEAVIVRLEEGRAAVLEERFDAELALGRHGAAIGRLQEAVAEQPLRERLWGLLARPSTAPGARPMPYARWPPHGPRWARSWASTRGRSCNASSCRSSTTTRP
jgi:DNA-binding SARP family transcriptional activator